MECIGTITLQFDGKLRKRKDKTIYLEPVGDV